jgi:predicted nucleotidyltransferase
MTTISLDVTGKLPAGLIEIYARVRAVAESLTIPTLIVGATARDIILVHGFGAAIERGTRDVDFGIQVKNWEHYTQLRDALIESGLTHHRQKTHQLSIKDSDGLPWEIDLIPFGGVSDANGQITWPPEHDFAMSVLGFEEAFACAWHVTLSQTPELTVRVASPPGILLLKLIAWTERGSEMRGKDAADIYYIVRHYAKIPQVFDALYDEGYMETQGYEEINASAMKLADDLLVITSPGTLSHLHARLLNDDTLIERLATDISRFSHADYDDAERLVLIIKEQLHKG